MANYVKSVNFAAKDALTTGDPLKAAKGTEVNTEFDNIATSIATKEDSANKDSPNGFPGLDASSLIADARLSTNIPRLASANTFTTTQTISAASPVLQLRETSQATDEKLWQLIVSGKALTLRTVNDAQSSATSGITIQRGTGIAISSIALSSTALTWNGNTLFTTANDGAGSGLDADLLDGSSSSFYLNSSNQSSGTLPDARFPATLPALSGVNLTSLNASNLASGTIPAARVGASSVTQHQASLALTADQVATTVTAKTTSFSVVAGDVEDILTCNSGSTINVTLNAGTHAVGDSTAFIKLGAGAVNFVAGASQTINSPGGLTSIAVQYGVVIATYRATNTWVLSGGLG